MDASFFAGLAVLPALAVCALLLRRLKLAVVRGIERPEPDDVQTRMSIAARVFATRRIFVVRLPHVTVAISAGRVQQQQQRAYWALLDEFAASDAEPVRSGSSR